MTKEKDYNMPNLSCKKNNLLGATLYICCALFLMVYSTLWSPYCRAENRENAKTSSPDTDQKKDESVNTGTGSKKEEQTAEQYINNIPPDTGGLIYGVNPITKAIKTTPESKSNINTKELKKNLIEKINSAKDENEKKKWQDLFMNVDQGIPGAEEKALEAYLASTKVAPQKPVTPPSPPTDIRPPVPATQEPKATTAEPAGIPAGYFTEHPTMRKCYKTEHFIVCYDKIRSLLAQINQIENPEYVSKIGVELEWIWHLYDNWGYKVPASTTFVLFPVSYAHDLLYGPNIAGNVSKEVAGEASAWGVSISCMQTNGQLIALSDLRRTLAHELFHRVQAQYYFWQVSAPAEFLREGTANLMEILVYPEGAEQAIRDNENATPVKFDTISLAMPWKNPRWAVPKTWYELEGNAMAFFLYLTDRFSKDVIREIFEQFSKTSMTSIPAIESAVKARGETGATLPLLFSDFAEDFFTSNPPANRLYPLLRTVRRYESPDFKDPIFKTHYLGTEESSTLWVQGMATLTARYYICERVKSAKVNVRLESGQNGLLVRLYQVKSEKTSYVTRLSAPNDLQTKDPLIVSPSSNIGVLLINRGSADADATIEFTLEEMKMGFLKGDGEKIDPRFAPGNPRYEVGETHNAPPDEPDHAIGVYCTDRGSKSLPTWGVGVSSYGKPEWCQRDFQMHTKEEKGHSEAVEETRRKKEAEIDKEEKRAGQKSRYRFTFEHKNVFTDKETISHWYESCYEDEKLRERAGALKVYIIYRDVFLIDIGKTDSNTQGDLLQECEEMIEKTKQLIDLRFPEVDTSTKPQA